MDFEKGTAESKKESEQQNVRLTARRLDAMLEKDEARRGYSKSYADIFENPEEPDEEKKIMKPLKNMHRETLLMMYHDLQDTSVFEEDSREGKDIRKLVFNIADIMDDRDENRDVYFDKLVRKLLELERPEEAVESLNEIRGRKKKDLSLTDFVEYFIRRGDLKRAREMAEKIEDEEWKKNELSYVNSREKKV